MARLLLRSLASTLTGVLAVLFGAAFAAACSCALTTTAEKTEAADLVARAVVADVDSPANPVSSEEQAQFTLEVSHVWKGEAGATVVVSSSVSGASCGLDWVAEGDELLLFAYAEGDGWTSNLCSGTAPVSEEFVAEVEEVLGAGTVVSQDANRAGGSDGDAASWLVPGGLVLGALIILGAGAAVLLLRRRSRAGA